MGFTILQNGIPAFKNGMNLKTTFLRYTTYLMSSASKSRI